MDFDTKFKDVRPYNDSEVQLGIERLIADENFEKVARFLVPGKSLEEVKQILRNIKSISEFQNKFSYGFVEYVIKETTDGLTFSGIENIKEKGHLFIANHRDIILDTAFMQIILKNNNIPTTEVTVGDNLMKNSLFRELSKLNKVFTLYRGGGKIQMYKNALLHSDYINSLIKGKNESLWIAQRDGRTKDGNDKTQAGLLKMLVGNRKDVVVALKELDIVPVSISYEYEPCLKAKTRETYIVSQGKEYVKGENDDMEQTVNSIFAQKGRVHLAFCSPLNKNIDTIAKEIPSDNALFENIRNFIDTQIHKNFKLWPNNYIAYDLLENSNKYSDKYDKNQIETFEKHINESIKEIDGDKEKIKEIALKIYANPVYNYENTTNE